MKQLFKIIIIFDLVLIGFIFTLGYLITKGEEEIAEIINPVNQEKIYFIKQNVFDNSRTIIGLDKRSSRFRNDPSDKFSNRNCELIFYKFESNGLVIYHHYKGNFKSPQNNKFETKIRFVKLNNPDFYNLYSNKKYREYDLNIFPDSEVQRLNYTYKFQKNN